MGGSIFDAFGGVKFRCNLTLIANGVVIYTHKRLVKIQHAQLVSFKCASTVYTSFCRKPAIFYYAPTPLLPIDWLISTYLTDA